MLIYCFFKAVTGNFLLPYCYPYSIFLTFLLPIGATCITPGQPKTKANNATYNLQQLTATCSNPLGILFKSRFPLQLIKPKRLAISKAFRKFPESLFPFFLPYFYQPGRNARLNAAPSRPAKPGGIITPEQPITDATSLILYSEPFPARSINLLGTCSILELPDMGRARYCGWSRSGKNKV
ncbi:hypothetical protein LJB86_03295 [Deltaproteobacteria bacterium OttesenSCG-928-M10]|nr:hypothetical protein [Deltaproteobacteria bacterium OttesenSCG-928-M10]